MFKLKMERLWDKFRFAWYFIEYCLAVLVSPLFKNKKNFRHLWIISERGTDAGDNGYHLFRYIRLNHPDMNVQYIISDNSPDREKVSTLGKIIRYRSFRHMLAFVLSEAKISTHIMGYSHDAYFFKILAMRGHIKGKKIFLQHGIIKDDLPYLYGDSNDLDLFVCGAKREYDFIRSHFRYRERVVQLLGLCRYDALPLAIKQKKSGSRTILLMPTWRIYLQELSDGAFKKSSFYRSYQSLLLSGELKELLKKYGYKLKFFPHHEILPYMKCFQGENEDIIFLSEGDDIQKNLIEADILITDYSSVFFDFAYMGKPVFYYQFDDDEVRSGHYQKGYFSYEKDGFGPVSRTERDLLLKLRSCMEQGGKNRALYEERIQAFFERRDDRNCERNFNAIRELLAR